MFDLDDFLARCANLETRLALTPERLSWRLFRDRRRLAQLRAGNSFLRPPTQAEALRRLHALEAVDALPSRGRRP